MTEEDFVRKFLTDREFFLDKYCLFGFFNFSMNS